jgi:thiamine-monophosphate kinase
LLAERALLAKLLARLPRPSPTVLVGPGDDAAVVTGSRNERLVVTTDAVVEGVHFSRAYSTPADIGHRALAVNLSDLAAMGATPRWALLSLVLPGSTRESDVEELVDGLAALATRHGVSIIGGNITSAEGPLVVDVTAGGEVGSRKWLTRSGAKPGDSVYVSGTIGGAAAGLEILRGAGVRGAGVRGAEVRGAGVRGAEVRGAEVRGAEVRGAEVRGAEAHAAEAHAAECIRRHKRPEARVKLGVALGRAKAARAAMDLSDGLADALEQVASASGVGVRVDADLLPIEPGAREWWAARGADPVVAALSGGDDYELLFAVPRKGHGALRSVRRHVTDPALTKIGEFTKDPRERVLVRAGRHDALPKGFEHFANR